MTRQESERGRVVIGMDAHKRSVTIELMDPEETVHGGGRPGTDVVGHKAMLASVKQWPDPGVGRRALFGDRATRGEPPAGRR